jgi:Glycosyl hydrolase family 3 C-terminal domain
VEVGEGKDRTNLSLSGNQDELIAAVAKVQKTTVVVLHVPGALLMDWLDLVSSVLCSFYHGQEDGIVFPPTLFYSLLFTVTPVARLFALLLYISHNIFFLFGF